MAPGRPPPMDGLSGPETKVHRGTATSCVSTALYGLCVCPLAVYSHCAPVSLRKEDVLVLRWCTRTPKSIGAMVVRVAAFSSSFCGLRLVPSNKAALSPPAHQRLTRAVDCNNICYMPNHQKLLNLAVFSMIPGCKGCNRCHCSWHEPLGRLVAKEKTMSAIHATMNISMDACCDHTQGLADDEFHAQMSDLFGRAAALLFGRNTYELLHGYWPNVASTGAGTPAEVRLAHILNEKPKYVSVKARARLWLERTARRRQRREHSVSEASNGWHAALSGKPNIGAGTIAMESRGRVSHRDQSDSGGPRPHVLGGPAE